MNHLQELEQQVRVLDAAITETRKRLPAHSVKPPVMMDLLDLEDQYDDLVKQIRELKEKRKCVSMIKPDFETTYTELRKRLTEIDYLANSTLLGAKIRENEPEITFFGMPLQISRTGVTDMSGRQINPALAVVLCQYVLHCPQVMPAGGEELVTFREFEASGPLSGYFVENTQKLIAGAFAGKISALESRCKKLEGVFHTDDNASYDLSVEFNALPRIPVFLRFNDRDEEFPAQCAILFRRSAGQFLDLQSLCICGTFLAGSLIGKSIVLPVPAAGAAPAESPSQPAAGAAEPLPV